jgi:hypothetical protein
MSGWWGVTMHQNRAILAVMFCYLLVIDNRAVNAQPLTSQKYQQAQMKQLPDRIISSRKIRGKFLRKVWGDYLYITVSTKSGEKVFLIDGNEDCFLIQNLTEQLAIDYDVLDRYTPQMGGYRRVNVIRNITSRKTNLKKWRRTVTQKEQDQCE